MLGMINEEYRLPLVPMEKGNKEKLKGIMERLGLLK
jgi:hypothetical protein